MFSSFMEYSLTTFGRVSEYICTPRAFYPMMPTIPSKDTVVTLHHLHSPPLDLVPPPIFDY